MQSHWPLSSFPEIAPSALLRRPWHRSLVCDSRQLYARASQDQSQPVALGIDLGTTYSAVAYARGRQVQLLTSQGHTLIPSVIAFALGKTLVGQEAKDQAAANPLNTFASIKVLMGQTVQPGSAVQPVGLHKCGSQNGQLVLHCPAMDRHFSPTELSAKLLTHLLSLAHDQLPTANKTIITVPARFSAAQRQATLQAAQMAGVEATLLQEPIAAALATARMSGPPKDELVLVFDLGGGTLDISLLDSFEGALEVVASHGDARLGGDDFDAALVDWLVARHCSSAAPARQDGSQLTRLRASARRAKEALSTSEQSWAEVPGPEGSWTQVPVSRRDLQDACQPLISRAWAVLAELGMQCKLAWLREPGSAAVQDAAPEQISGVGAAAVSQPLVDRYAPKPRHVDRVVLVGGSSLMPWVAAGLQSFTGLDVKPEADPQLCVALGAAIHAGVLAGLLSDTAELSDSTYQEHLHDRLSGS